MREIVQKPQTHWVMDYETMVNFFCGVFVHYKTDEKKIFMIHELQDDFEPFLQFLESNVRNDERHISFNGLSFDSQITQFIIKNRKTLLKCDTRERIELIYEQSQKLISNTMGDRKWPEWPEWKLSIDQIDVFKMNHWDNMNKLSSLKWIQCNMDWPNVQEMPIHHSQLIHTWEEIAEVVDYCTNDVLSTKKILHLSKPLVDVRTQVKNGYDMKYCYNYSNTKLGSKLLLQLYCDSTGREKRDVEKYRTERLTIPVHDILFPYIKFQTPELQNFHKMVDGVVITNTKKGFEHALRFKGDVFFFGAGGVHQCIKTGIYQEDDEWMMRDLDVASLYPSLACQNGMYPAHLGPQFFVVYKGKIVDVRLAEKAKPKKERNMAIIEGFKEAANATYGNSNSKFSWLYDPQYTMQTTINGQLSITMLVEDLLLNIPEAILLQTNTDGATFKFKRKYLPIYEKVCAEWEKVTKLTLEYVDYTSMYIWDVNNYFCIKTDGSAKCKGRFEWEDQQNYKYTHHHKNKSYLVVAKAIFNYFVNNITPERYLMENRNIYEYCGMVKIKGNWTFKQTCLKRVIPQEFLNKTREEKTKYLLDNGWVPSWDDDNWVRKDAFNHEANTGISLEQAYMFLMKQVAPEVETKDLQKTLRYYVSKNGCKIIKKNNDDGREIQLEAGNWMVTDFCKYVERPWEDYKIDESFYLEQIYKEIHNIAPPKVAQLEMNFL